MGKSIILSSKKMESGLYKPDYNFPLAQLAVSGIAAIRGSVIVCLTDVLFWTSLVKHQNLTEKEHPFSSARFHYSSIS